jgi:putative peptidoglycan lipid II flippase
VRAARTLLGAAAGIALVTVAARAVGFGRTAVFSRTVELTCLGDTYTVANAVPNVVFEIVAGGALASLVVPVLAPAVEAGDRAAASRTVSALLSWTLLVLTPVALVGLATAPLLVRGLLGSSECGPAAQTVGTAMLRVFSPQIVLYGVAVVLTGVLQAHRRFLGPALAPLLSSVVVAGSYLLYALRGRQDLDTLSRSQELVLSVGTTAGVAVLALVLVVPLRGTGLRLRPTLTFPPGVAGRVRRLAAAGVAGLAAQQVALVVALRLAADSARGGPARFTVATALFLLPWAVLAVPIATSAFPRMAAADDAGYADVTGRAVRAVVVLSLAGAAALAAVAVPAARLLDPDQAAALAGAVRAFAPGLLGYGLLALLTRALYARGQGRAAGTATVAGWLAVAAADVVLVLGTDLAPVTALGLGNTVGMTVAALLLVRAVRRRSPGALQGSGRTAATATVAALVAGGALTALPLPADPAVPATVLLGAGLAGAATLLYAGLLRVADPAALRGLRRG